MSSTVATRDAVREHAEWMRGQIVDIAAQPLGAHLGGSLSAVDILAVLFFDVLRLRPEEPDWPDRDHFILSKGHASAALYSALSRRGFFDPDELSTYGRSGSRLAGHPMRRVPGVELPTGSLGHGLSLGSGLALGAKRDERPSRTFVLLGDGELQEGAVWEAAAAAGALELDNLVAIVDVNGWQMTGPTTDHGNADQLAERWAAFGWTAVEIDGHDLPSLARTLRHAPIAAGVPTVVLARTTKGRGVPFLEDDGRSHYVRLSPRLHRRARASLATTSRDRREP